MRRILIIYAFIISLLSVFAYLGLTNLAESIIEFWHYKNPELGDLPPWTENAPIVTRVALVIPIALCILTLNSVRASHYQKQYLVHGIGLAALTLATVTIYTIVAAIIPSIGKIITLPIE